MISGTKLKALEAIVQSANIQKASGPMQTLKEALEDSLVQLSSCNQNNENIPPLKEELEEMARKTTTILMACDFVIPETGSQSIVVNTENSKAYHVKKLQVPTFS